MTTVDPQIIQSYFSKVLVAYVDAIDNLTALYEEGKTPDEALLHEHVMYVSRQRDKLVMTVNSAKLHHGNDLGLVIPNLHLGGGIC